MISRIDRLAIELARLRTRLPTLLQQSRSWPDVATRCCGGPASSALAPRCSQIQCGLGLGEPVAVLGTSPNRYASLHAMSHRALGVARQQVDSAMVARLSPSGSDAAVILPSHATACSTVEPGNCKQPDPPGHL